MATKVLMPKRQINRPLISLEDQERLDAIPGKPADCEADLKKPEIWKSSVQGYEASSYGRIRSITRVILNRGRRYLRKGKIIDIQEDEFGYLFVRINPQGIDAYKKKDGTARTKRFFVHRLVIESFKGACPESMKDLDGTYQVDHWSRDRSNNSPTNLRYTNRATNSLNRVLNPACGEDSPQSRITQQEARTIILKSKEGLSMDQILNHLLKVNSKVTKGIIKGILSGKTWKHLER